MTNPYETPTSFDETAAVSPAATQPVSLIWFGVGVVSTSYMLYLYTYNVFSVSRVTELLIKSVIPVTFFAMAALFVYRIVRFMWPRNLQFTSSPFSLVNAGAIVGVYCGGLEYCSLHVWGQRNQPAVYLTGFLIGFPLCFVVMYLERLFAGTQSKSVVAMDANSTSRASVFYFSGVAFASAFVFSCGSLGFQEYFGLIITTTMLGFLLTGCYAAMSFFFRRRHAPTTTSRVVAAIASSVVCFGILILARMVRESDPTNLLAMPAGAMVGVALERLLLARTSFKEISTSRYR